jgi:hypothetical protein
MMTGRRAIRASLAARAEMIFARERFTAQQ